MMARKEALQYGDGAGWSKNFYQIEDRLKN